MDQNRKRKREEEEEEDPPDEPQPHCSHRHQEPSEVTKKVQVLLNPLILAKISKNLPAKSLITLRRGCKSWNSIMVPEMHQRGKEIVAICEYNSDNNPSSLQKFNASMKPSACIPFANYDMRFRIGDGPSHDATQASFEDPVIHDLFATCGTIMRVLKLDVQFDKDDLAFTNGLLKIVGQMLELKSLGELKLAITFNKKENNGNGAQIQENSIKTPRGVVIPSLPLLKILQLKFNICNGDETWPPGSLSCVPDLLLPAAVALERLGLTGHWTFNAYMLDALAKNAKWHKALRVLMGLRIKNNGSAVTTMGSLPQMHLLQLTELQVELENHCTTNLLTEFLVRQSSHLKLLKIHHVLHDNPEEDPFTCQLNVPALPNLETLELKLVPDYPTYFSLTLIPDGFPKLKTIAYEQWGQDASFGFWVDFLPPFPYLGVTTLMIHGISLTHHLKILAVAFPSLTCLRIGLRQAVLPDLWTKWPALEILHVMIHSPDDWGSEEDDDYEMVPSLDSCLTGIMGAEILGEVGDVRGDFSKYTYLHLTPGIRNLTELKVFSLYICNSLDLRLCIPYDHLEGARHWQYITDISGYQAFAVPGSKLRYLKLWEHVGMHLSDECKAAIRDALGPTAQIEICFHIDSQADSD